METVEDVVSITNAIPEKMVKNCMLFLMRKNINPVWEDPLNCNGGCFSFKVLNKNVLKVWKELSYTITGETLSNKKEFMENTFDSNVTRSENGDNVWYVIDIQEQAEALVNAIIDSEADPENNPPPTFKYSNFPIVFSNCGTKQFFSRVDISSGKNENDNS